jgi:phosphoglycolate phosphatase
VAKSALIFDLDGTLIDSAPDIHASVNTVMAAEGLPALSLAQVGSFVGNGVAVLLKKSLAAHGLPDHGAQYERVFKTFAKVYEHAQQLTVLYPGVYDALGALADHPMALCTNKPELPSHAVLRHFKMARFFKAVVGGDTLAQRKPDPAPLHAALAQLGGGPALFIGDSEIDAETAARAGIPFVLFTEGYRKSAVETFDAAAVFSDWGTLPQIVARLS